MRTALLGMLLAITLAGCQWSETGQEAAAYGKQAETISTTLAKSIDDAEVMISRLEDTVGSTLSEESIGKIEAAAKKVQAIAAGVDKVTTTAAIIPGPQQGYAVGADAVVGGIGALAGAVAAFMARRRQKKTELALRSVAKAVDQTPGVGKAITSAATAAGVAGIVAEQYQQMKAGA